MRQVFTDYSQELPELLNAASELYTTCSRAFGQALSAEINGLPRNTSPDSPLVEEVRGKWQRGLLLNRIGILYATAVVDLLRMRLTAPLGYVRLQCESIALVKLMSEDPSIAHQWVNIATDQEGRAFESVT